MNLKQEKQRVMLDSSSKSLGYYVTGLPL